MNEQTKSICFTCKTPLENVHPTSWEETQTVREPVYTEDDGYWVYHDKKYIVKAMIGYCPNCQEQKTKDWWSGLWW